MDCTVHGILQARMLEWAAVPFSSGSSPPRNQTRVSCIAGRFFTSWATREAWYFVIPGILQIFSSLYLLWWPMISDLCSFMIVWRAMKWGESHSVMSDSLWPHGLYSPWNSPGQNIGVGSLSFFQGIFPTQESNWVSCSAGRFFTNWAIREAQGAMNHALKWWWTCWIAEIISDLDNHINFVDKAAVLWQPLSKLYLSNLVIYILTLDIMPFVKSSLIHRHASSINHQDPVL